MWIKGNRKGLVRFTFKSEKLAKQVQLAGDFSSWRPVDMKKMSDGSYVAEAPVKAGMHEYKFVVDGQWITDPDNHLKAANPFGGANSVVRLD